jgi:hypothetical protein
VAFTSVEGLLAPVITLSQMNNAESVREFQPRVCFETLGAKTDQEIVHNPEGVASLCAPPPAQPRLVGVAASTNRIRFARVSKQTLG